MRADIGRARSLGEGARCSSEGDLERVCLDEAGRCDVPGIGIWSDTSLDSDERRVLAEWSDRWGR
ncbi:MULTISPECIES: hypothetical protein [Sandaracinus]|uniref:hypothetical protein n=1 Tax=Sandaracinus TaxID=1055688 RepID=UPI0019D4E24B|nr:MULTISPECIES: hypothetical protein [Sandaracinus]UJR87354.1 Hypothetical protein I5071_1460 [Sandaracinus amylolyticus]